MLFATCGLLASGTWLAPSAVMMVTALRSESNPMPGFETSFTTMASNDFAASFLRAFASTFSVSAANPMMSWFFRFFEWQTVSTFRPAR